MRTLIVILTLAFLALFSQSASAFDLGGPVTASTGLEFRGQDVFRGEKLSGDAVAVPWAKLTLGRDHSLRGWMAFQGNLSASDYRAGHVFLGGSVPLPLGFEAMAGAQARVYHGSSLGNHPQQEAWAGLRWAFPWMETEGRYHRSLGNDGWYLSGHLQGSIPLRDYCQFPRLVLGTDLGMGEKRDVTVPFGPSRTAQPQNVRHVDTSAGVEICLGRNVYLRPAVNYSLATQANQSNWYTSVAVAIR